MRSGTCIFIHNYLRADTVNAGRYCLDFDIELCAIKIQCGSFHMYVLSGNFTNFMQKMDEALKSLYKLKTEIIICGDFNIDYITDNYKKINLSPIIFLVLLTFLLEY
jgi:endonuclease/exonuclease/phosphatase family metal-dependent hydrolase